MAELNEQVHIEDHTLAAEGEEASEYEAVRLTSCVSLDRINLVLIL